MNKFPFPSDQKQERKFLNLGCGSRFHPDWVNVDLISNSPFVIKHDLRKTLPFPDEMFDVVYHSHLLEHFDRIQAAKFLRECYRVCRTHGTIRVVVPDLETITRLYLKYLELVLACRRDAEPYYNWMMLELYDQVVRKASGGDMAVFLKNVPPDLTEFLRNRMGNGLFLPFSTSRLSLLERVFKLVRSPSNLLYHGRRALTTALLIILWGPLGSEIGKEVLFRMKGETHQWMYDRFSLSRAIELGGFSNPKICSANESGIEGWLSFGLDIEPDGTPYKPDSLYCEAVKIEAD